MESNVVNYIDKDGVKHFITPDKAWKQAITLPPELEAKLVKEKEVKIIQNKAEQMKINTKDPLWIKRIGGFLKTAAQHIISGQEFLPKEKIEERLKICLGCEKFRQYKTDGKTIHGVCGVEHQGCGCNIKDSDGTKFTNKLAYPLAICPANPPKWGQVIKEDEKK